jgi:hypothetical protein
MRLFFTGGLTAFGLTVLLVSAVHGQDFAPFSAVGTGSISGVVRDENDLAVEAEVTVATQGFSQEASFGELPVSLTLRTNHLGRQHGICDWSPGRQRFRALPGYQWPSAFFNERRFYYCAEPV